MSYHASCGPDVQQDEELVVQGMPLASRDRSHERFECRCSPHKIPAAPMERLRWIWRAGHKSSRGILFDEDKIAVKVPPRIRCSDMAAGSHEFQRRNDRAAIRHAESRRYTEVASENSTISVSWPEEDCCQFLSLVCGRTYGMKRSDEAATDSRSRSCHN